MKYFRRDFIKEIIFGILGIGALGGGVMSSLNRKNRKKKKFAYTVPEKHWVGDGFNVHALLRPSDELNPYISPFILMDYSSPKYFAKTNKPKGVGEHPHRGFETVTLAFQGEVEHRDSSGGGGVIKPGDVQWMTAGSGVVHDEFHSEEFSRKGGTFEMVQLWVNLPRKDKMTKPKYQGIEKKDIPVVQIAEKSDMRIIAGDYKNVKGPSSTFTPINIYDIKSEKSETISLELKNQTNTVLLILRGQAELEQTQYNEQSVIIFEQFGSGIEFKTSSNFKALLLNGEPINEPMFAHGPFVMNTEEEIYDAIRDFQSGKMGKL